MFAYEKTPLENWIENLYKKLEISHPSQLNIFNLAENLDIWVYFKEMTSRSFELDGLQTVIIDKRISLTEQWLDFLHELCHLLLHSGNQTNMSNGLLELQEEQTCHFQLYAAMPYFMVKKLQLPYCENDIINLFVSEFRVSYQLATKRLDQIKRRDYQVRSQKELVHLLQSQYHKYDPANWSDETKQIMCKLQHQLATKGISMQHG
jgi:Zn-dependent peptidase ImmA (M78 family)